MAGPATRPQLVGSAEIPAPDSADGCTDCQRQGGWWVHLRQFTSGGHVACCDSAPTRHATAHFPASAHPAVRSFAPNESWRWCYLDQQVA